VASGGITADHLVGPVRIYSRLMTPRWLQSNANFHSARVSTINDTEVSFGAAGTGNQFTRLLTVPLLPPNTLKPNEAYLVRIVINQVVVGTDNDPAFGITDGTHFAGIMKLDEANTEAAWALRGQHGDNLTSPVFTGMGSPGQNAQNFEVLLRLGPAVPLNARDKRRPTLQPQRLEHVPWGRHRLTAGQCLQLAEHHSHEDPLSESLLVRALIQGRWMSGNAFRRISTSSAARLRSSWMLWLDFLSLWRSSEPKVLKCRRNLMMAYTQ
jgi:hypothetical protein